MMLYSGVFVLEGTDDGIIRYTVYPYGAHNPVAKMRPKHSELKILVANKMRSSLNTVSKHKRKARQ